MTGKVTMWARAGQRLAELVAGGVVAAVLVTGFEIGWRSFGALPAAALIILPLSTSVVCGIVLVLRLTRSVQESLLASPRAVRTCFRLAASLSAVAVLLAIGGFLSNDLFIDEPASGITLVGYVATLAVSAGAGALVWVWSRGLRTPTPTGLRRFASVVFAIAAAWLAFIDASFLPTNYHQLHVVLGLAVITMASAAVAFMVDDKAVLRRAFGGALGVCMLAFTLTPKSALSEVFSEPTVARRVVGLARLASDRDGDGFSAVFGGGDCDDADLNAYPLSLQGRDCLGWSAPAPRRIIRAASTTKDERHSPDIVLLVTVDALRCGFGVADRQELRNACPRLTEFAREGRFSGSGHTSHPSTSKAMCSLMRLDTGDQESRVSIAASFRKLGYASAATVTHPYALCSVWFKGDDTFDVIDKSLVPVAMRPEGITSDQVTDRVISQIENALAKNERTLFWAHYFDAHAPYVQVPGSHFAGSSLDGYVAELARVDFEIGRLFDRVKQLAGARATIVLTADHGEEFDEHEATRHGTNVYEQGTRVPYVAWNAGPEPRQGLPELLPANHFDVGHYLLSLVTGQEFKPSSATYLEAKVAGDEQFGVVEGDWKLVYRRTLGLTELYNLSNDPEERVNLGSDRSDVLRRLGPLLGTLYLERGHEFATVPAH